MAAVKRAACASGAWLLKRVMQMARPLSSGGSRRQFFEGYLLIAKQTGDISNLAVLDPPSYLCLPGPLYEGAVREIDKAYVQTLYQGRDTYLPGSVTTSFQPQLNPLVRAVVNSVMDFGEGASGARLATRLWGGAQPFVGSGCMYGYGAVYLSTDAERLALGNATPGDQFVYRLDVFTPTFARSETTNGVETLIPENPTAEPTTWTLEIPESLISNAKSFIRLDIDRSLITPDNYNIITFWDVVQYPWIGFSAPRQFFDDDGNVGYRVHVCAQVVYEEGGPYEVDPEAVFYP
jgi:hypothetical protein